MVDCKSKWFCKWYNSATWKLSWLGLSTLPVILKISSRSFFVIVILRFACDICMHIKPRDSISVNQHGIWSAYVYWRLRAISKAVQSRNEKCHTFVTLLRDTSLALARSVQKLFCWNFHKWGRLSPSAASKAALTTKLSVLNNSSSVYWSLE